MAPLFKTKRMRLHFSLLEVMIAFVLTLSVLSCMLPFSNHAYQISLKRLYSAEKEKAKALVLFENDTLFFNKTLIEKVSEKEFTQRSQISFPLNATYKYSAKTQISTVDKQKQLINLSLDDENKIDYLFLKL